MGVYYLFCESHFRRESVLKTEVFAVEGMTCGHCEAAVEKGVGNVSGVERSSADSGRGSVEVAYDEGRVTTENIRSAVEDAEYALAG
jgi:copper ion binding protein